VLPRSARRAAFGLVSAGWLFLVVPIAPPRASEAFLALIPVIVTISVWTAWRNLRGQPHPERHAVCAFVPALLFAAMLAVVVAPLFESIAGVMGYAATFGFDSWRGIESVGQGLCAGILL